MSGSRILWEPTSPFAIRVWRGPEIELAKILCRLLTTLTGVSIPLARLLGFDVMATVLVVAGRDVPYIVALLAACLVLSAAVSVAALSGAFVSALAGGYSR